MTRAEKDSVAKAQDRKAVGHVTQSENSLSRTTDDADDGRFRVAEEVNLDEQSDQARRVGQMPDDIPAAGAQGAAQDEEQNEPQTVQQEQNPQSKLKQAMDRASPPSPLR